MRRILKRCASLMLMPLARWYLSKPRKYKFDGIAIIVSPGVFHPGLFHSSKMLLRFLSSESIKDQTFLELGCGTGLISIWAAKRGAIVTASDLSKKAIGNAIANIANNDCAVNVIQSDLFVSIPNQTFDWIIINPPYYRAAINDESQLAWNAGVNFEYFTRLFSSLGNFMNSNSKTIMVLTLGTDVERIMAIGRKHGFGFNIRAAKKMLFDKKDIVFQIIRG